MEGVLIAVFGILGAAIIASILVYVKSRIEDSKEEPESEITEEPEIKLEEPESEKPEKPEPIDPEVLQDAVESILLPSIVSENKRIEASGAHEIKPLYKRTYDKDGNSIDNFEHLGVGKDHKSRIKSKHTREESNSDRYL